MSKKFVNLKVNPEDNDYPDHAVAQRKYGINGFPTVAFLSSESGLLSLNPGYRDTEGFAPLMEEAFKEESRFQQLKANYQKMPNDPDVIAGLAIAYVKWNLVDKGQPFIDKALKLDPENKTGRLPEIYLNLGLHYGGNAGEENAEENLQMAENHFNIIIQKYRQSNVYELARLYLGITYAIQEKLQMAITTLEKLSNAKDPEIKARAEQFMDQVKVMAESTN